MHHKLGHEVPAMLRKVSLQDSQGAPMGTVLLFYPAEEVDALPRGESGEGVGIEASQAEMEDRLDAAHHQWATSGMSFGLLWITVDQAKSLRKTHGRDACEAMLRAVEDSLLRQMKPAETIGRWGDNEFLIIAHERSAELLTDHARRLAGLARTVDFRWWGDRIGLTLSIGTSFEIGTDTLQCLLNRARQAMRTSEYVGPIMSLRRGKSNASDHRNCRRFRSRDWRFPDGERTYPRPHPDPASRVGDHRRRSFGHHLDRQSGLHYQGHDRRCCRRAEPFEIQQGSVPEHSEDDVRAVQ